MAGKSNDIISSAKTLLRPDLIERGLRNPGQIPPFILGVLFPDSRWAPNWREEDGYVTFVDGGFAGGNPSRPELSTRIYREVRQLRELLPEEQYDRSLEIGCGYGRLSGWIADHASEAVGVDPNEEAIEIARTMYPELSFVTSGAEDLPFPDDSFELVVSWGVLQHVHPEAIEQVAAEVRRVLDDGATIVLCEQTSGTPGRRSWVRSVAEYQSLFAPCELHARAERPAEPTFDHARYAETMAFTRDNPAVAEVADTQPTAQTD